MRSVPRARRRDEIPRGALSRRALPRGGGGPGRRARRLRRGSRLSSAANAGGCALCDAGEPGFAQTDAVERYWTGFADPMLTGLIDDALAHNKDLGVAEANLRAARAAKRLAGFDQYPTVTFAGGYSHNLDSQQQLPGVDQHDREFDAAQGRLRRSMATCSAASGANVEAARGDLGAARGDLAGCAGQRHRRGGARLSDFTRAAGSAGVDRTQCRQSTEFAEAHAHAAGGRPRQ